jgi:hypothetical protein
LQNKVFPSQAVIAVQHDPISGPPTAGFGRCREKQRRLSMRKTPKTLLAIVSLLVAGGATAMAAPSSHRANRVDSHAGVVQYTTRAQASDLRYDPSTYAFEPTWDAGQTLFDRAKGSID